MAIHEVAPQMPVWDYTYSFAIVKIQQYKLSERKKSNSFPSKDHGFIWSWTLNALSRG